MPESALLDLTARDVTELAWEHLVASMTGVDPDTHPGGGGPSSCDVCACDCDPGK